MGELDNLTDGALGFIKDNAIGLAIGGAGVAVGAGLGTAALIRASKRRKTKRHTRRNSRKRGHRIKHTSRGWKQDRKRFNKRQKWEVAYRRRKTRHSRSKIRYTKNGQPYKIMANGRARFIKGKRRAR